MSEHDASQWIAAKIVARAKKEGAGVDECVRRLRAAGFDVSADGDIRKAYDLMPG